MGAITQDVSTFSMSEGTPPEIIRRIDRAGPLTPEGQQEAAQLLRDHADTLPEPYRTKVLNVTESSEEGVATSRYFHVAFAAFIKGCWA